MLNPQILKNNLRTAVIFFEDIIFPRRCVCCGRYNEYSYLCHKCFGTLPICQKLECMSCGAPSKAGESCVKCSKQTSIDNFFVASRYSDRNVVKIIKTFKYRFIADLSTPLSKLMTKYINRLIKLKNINIFQDNPILIPVPLHTRRLNWRGFNQSELLAQKLGDTFQLNTRTDVLIRKKEITPQAEVEIRQRVQNVKNIFSCKNKRDISGKHIMLIDDICTTGSTLNECAKALKKAGVKNVSAIVVAKG
jgi:ComF family protein